MHRAKYFCHLIESCTSIAPAIKPIRATYTIARFESSKPFKSRYSFDDIRAHAFQNSKFQRRIDTWRADALPWRRAALQCESNGTTAYMLVPSVDSAPFRSLYLVHRISFPVLRFPPSFLPSRCLTTACTLDVA